MKIMIDILHPAHVHFFRNFIKIMKDNNHEILVTSRDKEITNYLLNVYDIDYISISSISKNKVGLLKELSFRNYKFLKIAKKFKPDVLMGIMGATIAPVGKLLNIPSYVFYDTENAKLTNKFVYPTATKFITPDCYKDVVGKNHIKYNGYHELAYLHPDYFKPDPSVLNEANLSKDDIFTIIRFVSWGASHDIGHSGISFENKKKAVENFSKFGEVIITSERKLSSPLDKYRMSIPPEDIHSLIYYSSLLYGESATIASEASILGTYSIYIDNEGRGYTDDQEKRYGLVNNFNESKNNQLSSIEKGIEILNDNNSKKEARKKSKKLLSEKIDVTKFMVNFVEETTEGD